MSRLIARILLTIFMIPLGVIVYAVTIAIIEETRLFQNQFGYRRFPLQVSCASLTTWIFFAIYWVLLWRGQVRWTARRKIGSIVMVGVAVFVALLLGLLCTPIDNDFGILIGSIVAPLLWLVGTVLLWQETRAERAARLAATNADAVMCPTCGYNLTGLSEARCPECGTKFTLNDLLSRQPHREAAKIEQEISG